jgi:hypothetical protein
VSRPVTAFPPAARARFVPRPLWPLFLLNGPATAVLARVYLVDKPTADTLKSPVRWAGPFTRAR